MPTISEDRVRRARKSGPCYFCGELLEAGEEYVERLGVEPGYGWWTMRAHPECVEATRYWLDWDFETFDPGSMPRGGEE